MCRDTFEGPALELGGLSRPKVELDPQGKSLRGQGKQGDLLARLIVDPRENHHLFPDNVAVAQGASVTLKYPAHAEFFKGESTRHSEERLIDEFDYAYADTLDG